MSQCTLRTAAALSGAAAIASLAGLAGAQVTVDGRLGPGESAIYGGLRWTQNVPTGFGDAGAANPCDPGTVGGDPAAVTTGVEFAIPLSALGNPAGPIGLFAFVNGQGHDFVSNQTLPGLPNGTGSLGGDGMGGFIGGDTPVAGVNFNTFAGQQFLSFAPVPAPSAPTIDGTRDAVYGAPLALQTTRTSFGNATTGGQNAGGSELDAVYAVVHSGVLYVMLTGNMQSNFNKLELFLDTLPGGENTLSNTNPDVDFNGLNRLAGLTFDAGFSPDFYITFGAGNDPVEFFPNFATVGSATPVGRFLGSNQAGNGSGTLNGGDNPDGIQIALDNSNTAGVDGFCPPPAGNPDVSNGSELDGLYAAIDTQANRLHVLVTGNLENGNDNACQAGGNKIVLFFDADGADGQNVLRTDNVDISFGMLNRMGGLTFDPAFAPDYWISFKTQQSAPASQVIDAAVLRANGPVRDFNGYPLDYGAYDGGNKNDPARNPIRFQGMFACNGNAADPQPQDGFTTNIFTNFAPRTAGASLIVDPFNPMGTPGLLLGTIDNSNIAGVTGDSAAGAAAVTTGLEVSIDLDELGWDGASPIRIGGFIVNNDGTFLSNQVLGGLPDGTPNLGSVGATSTINFATIPGNQYVEISADAGCVADVDDGSGSGTPDGAVTIDDLLFYLFVFEGGVIAADVDDGSGTGTPDGAVTIDDLLYFLLRFEAGC